MLYSRHHYTDIYKSYYILFILNRGTIYCLLIIVFDIVFDFPCIRHNIYYFYLSYFFSQILPIRLSLSWLSLVLNPVSSRRLMPEVIKC